MPKGPGQGSTGSGQMEVLANLLGKPIMHLNQLTRFFVKSSLACFMILSLLFASHNFLNVPNSFFNYAALTLITAGTLFFLGGFGLKFLPSSLGSNPHVHSLVLGVWSYWLIFLGTILLIAFAILELFTPNYFPYFMLEILGGILIFSGSFLLFYNLSKSMEQRV